MQLLVQSGRRILPCRRTMRIMRHGRPGPPQSRLSDAALLAARSRAAELLIAAAAHRISVEHWLAAGQRQSSRAAGGGPGQLVMAEMIEAWMTGEDAVEVASWHMKAGQAQGLGQLGLGQGASSSTCDRASCVFEEAFNEVFKCRQEHGKEPKTGYAAPPPALHCGPVLSGWQDGSCWVQRQRNNI